MPGGRCLLFLVLLWILPEASALAQVNPLLQEIAELQCHDDPFYRDGMMPSSRWGGGKAREDNNIFFTALTVYTLQSLYPHFTDDEQRLADRIIRQAQQNYSYYRNRNDALSYNFWQVHPFEQPFPQRKLLSKLKKFRLADDLDDTALIYLTLSTPDSTALQVRQMMEAQIDQQPVRSTLPEYRDLPVYRTWFADKMKQDLDICVMANVLLFVFEKDLPLSKADRQTMQLISRMVRERQHISQPALVSPHYQQTSIILYHLSRLLVAADHPLLEPIRAQLISDLYASLQKDGHPMEKVILLSSLYRLGEHPDLQPEETQVIPGAEPFYWFRANPFSGKRLWMKRTIFRRAWLQARYSSPAYYRALQLEMQLLSRLKEKDVSN